MKMRKTFVVLTVAVMLCALTACTTPAANEPDTNPTAATTVATTAASATTATDTAATTTTTAPAAEPIVYESEKLPFTLTMPASWDGAFAVRESDTSVIFYELQNHQYNTQGRLFTIRFIAEDSYEEGMFPEYTALGQHGGYYVIAIRPTDVQYTAELEAPYTKMYAECDSVLDTFKYTG